MRELLKQTFLVHLVDFPQADDQGADLRFQQGFDSSFLLENIRRIGASALFMAVKIDISLYGIILRRHVLQKVDDMAVKGEVFVAVSAELMQQRGDIQFPGFDFKAFFNKLIRLILVLMM